MKLQSFGREMDLQNNQSNKKTADVAAKFLCEINKSFKVPSKKEKRNLVLAFASKNKIVYGRAFDIIKLKEDIDLMNVKEIIRKLNNIILYEIKSTNRSLKKDFAGYFFSLSTAELLTAQNLKENFKFVFVNIKHKEHFESTLQELFARSKNIYPSWSISF